jgi:fused signal recognition particle receptor
MFSFFKKNLPPRPPRRTPDHAPPAHPRRQLIGSALAPVAAPDPAAPPAAATRARAVAGQAQRRPAQDRLQHFHVFTGTRIDDALYEELEEALLMADTGVKATQHLLDDLKRRVKDSKAPPTRCR